jgi:hypothetical protein
MVDELPLSFRSTVSGRHAIVSDEGDSIWLYLTSPGSTRPERDCWLLNKPSAAAEPHLPDYKTAGLPPPAPASIIDEAGVRELPSADRWSARWSSDGETVAIAVDGVEIGLATITEPRGIALYLTKTSPWGRPWDATLVARLL